ncbi:hypothetical protein IWQ60_003851 [Tieghemiomyces parasiticus]|uniref:Uncharacterized protein n=1 Tax=Tieghemiomyces parasiticus TaxID=78921 RepID=A0A9W8AES1_9FUNG|nr:hypothetical protein IWQ60_003851 [Tieghemiomyces parasiticus]
MVLCAFFTKLMFTERVASSFIHTLLGLVNTPLILIANVWLLALTVVVWRNLRFVRVPPQFRRDYRLVTVLTAVVTVAFTTTSLTGKHLGQPFITISSFIASVVITVLADTLLIITIFVAVGGIRFLQTSYLKTLGLTWDLNVVHRLSVASFPESPRHSTTTTVDSQAEEKIHPFTAEVVRPGPRINRPLTSVTLATVAHSTLSRATSSRSKTETVAGDLLGHCGNARGEEYPLHGETAATRFYGPHPTAPRPDSCIEVTEEDIVAQPTTSEPTQSRVTIDGIPEQLATMLDTTGPSQLLSSSYGEPNMFASSKTGPLGLRPPQPALQLRPLNSLGVNSKRRPTPVINPSFVPSFPSELVPNAKSSSPAKSTVANATSAPYSPTFSTAATKVLDPETGSPNLVASSSIGVLRGVELAGGRHSLKKVLQRGSKYLSLNERTFRKPSGKSNGS